MAFINKDILGNFFVKIYKIFNQYQTGKAMEELELRYQNSIILGKVSITPDCKLGNHTVIHPGICLSNAIIGDYTYVLSSISNTTIGKFCSIAPSCRIGTRKHPSKNFVSTSPVFFSKNNGCQMTFVKENLFEECERIEIGNDVWVGTNSTILDGVKIGDGAIIGAGAVVTKNVDDYAIVGGVPAKLLRYRFEKQQIDFLKSFKWWDKDIKWIEKNHESFINIDDFIKSHM
jgi:acetyltransferase-like isoleucine patch superfamily enzyme